MKTIIVTIIIVLAVSTGIFLLKSKTYNNLNELLKAQEKKGYVLLGKFGNNWPAKVTEKKTAMNEITFTLENGTQHTYPGYDNYKLKVIRLLAKNNKENVIVFRSEKKMADKSLVTEEEGSQPFYR